jgi:hypothetical protein
MDSSIKSLTITGSAAEDATRSRLKAAGLGTRRKRAQVKDEEDEFIEQAKNFTIQAKLPVQVKPVVLQAKVEPKIEAKPEPKVELKVEPKVEPKVQELKVILNPPKHSRVKLQPKTSNIKHAEPLVNTTRRARRIKLNVSNLTHRFTRAKKVKDDTEKKSMESVREYLIQKGVIQAKSKAPEKMLRSMYADFMMLKDQAL